MTSTGVYGHTVSHFSTQKPFYISGDTPLVLVNSDKVIIPVTLTNNMGHDIEVTLLPNASGSRQYIDASIQAYEVDVPKYSSVVNHV